ncbi:MAG: 2,3-bisphosphoglycerate-independent phosphoglycerate mutase [Candidatus Zixiibacteriota bacterium]
MEKGSAVKPDLIEKLAAENNSRIVMLVMDGLGDIPADGHGTPLQEAATPNLDKLAAEGVLGQFDPIAPGITPGSGPAHLGLFGYDPVENNVGRGILSAFGIGFDLTEKDVAARINFCTLDSSGNVTDRRAGRISDDENRRICEKIKSKLRTPAGIEFFLETESQHRGLLVIRGNDLSDQIADTDPQQTGVPTHEPKPLAAEADHTSKVLMEILQQVRQILSDEEKANMILLRGYSGFKQLPSMQKRFGVKACAIAEYPMYRGLATLVGMTVQPPYTDFDDAIAVLKSKWKEFTFFFLHVKKTDSYGEDGNFESKKQVIEDVDKVIVPGIMAMKPDVLIVTGDHSTPWSMKAHSWHPTPVLLHSKLVRRDKSDRFSEIECQTGGLGRLPLVNLMPIALSCAGKLAKFGA